MSLVRKLKPDRNITSLLIPFIMFVIFGLAAIALGLSGGVVVLAILVWLYALYSFYVFLRTRNFPHLFISVYQVFLGSVFYLFSQYYDTDRIEPIEYRVAFMAIISFFLVILFYLAATRKLKWRGREIFELAGEPVEETGNGYTSRPRPVGKVDYSLQQIHDFAKFLARHLIALPYYSSQNITFVPIKMGDEFGRLLGLSGDYRDATWVNFDVNGEVSVHIAQKDYLDYRQSLAFDPLCTSLGQVFIDFLELVKKNEGVRLIDRLDDLKIPYYS